MTKQEEMNHHENCRLRDIEDSRVRSFSVGQFTLLNFLRGEVVCGFEGLPDDAKVVGVNCNFPNRCFYVLFWSHSYDPVPHGSLAPDMGPITLFYGERPEKKVNFREFT